MTREEQIAALRTAETQLLTGQAVVRVQSAGRMVEYRPADLAQLRTRLAELEAEAAGQAPRGSVGFQW